MQVGLHQLDAAKIGAMASGGCRLTLEQCEVGWEGEGRREKKGGGRWWLGGVGDWVVGGGRGRVVGGCGWGWAVGGGGRLGSRKTHEEGALARHAYFVGGGLSP